MRKIFSNRKLLANSLLTLSGVVAVFSYPISTTCFVGGLVFSGCISSFIAGAADYFGVKALTRKPLGISGKWIATEVIPRRKEQLFEAIVDTIQNELFTKENLQSFLQKYDISSIIVQFLKEQERKAELLENVDRLLIELFEQMDPEEVGTLVENFVKNNIEKIKIVPILIEAADWTIKNGYDRKIIDFIISELIQIVQNPIIVAELRENISNILNKYENNGWLRGIVNAIIDITPNRLVELLVDYVTSFLNKLGDYNHPDRKQIHQWIYDKLFKLKTDPQFQQYIEQIIQSWIKKLSIKQWMVDFIPARKLAAAGSESGVKKAPDIIKDVISKWIKAFEQNTEQHKKVDQWIKDFVLGLLDHGNEYIGKIVRDQLDKYNDDQKLVALIEEKAGNELHMVRVNGSLVGLIAGIAFYFLAYLITHVTTLFV